MAASHHEQLLNVHLHYLKINQNKHCFHIHRFFKCLNIKVITSSNFFLGHLLFMHILQCSCISHHVHVYHPHDVHVYLTMFISMFRLCLQSTFNSSSPLFFLFLLSLFLLNLFPLQLLFMLADITRPTCNEKIQKTITTCYDP